MKNLTPDIILTPSSVEISVNVLLKYKPNIPVYYIQHSNIINNGKKFTLKKKFWNKFNKIFTGISTYNNTEKPPFNSEQITYLLWSELYTNNVIVDDYKIRLLPRITIGNLFSGHSKRRNGLRIKNILVILNKRQNIGKKAWTHYANFYLNAFKGTNYNVIYKVHPSEDLAYNQAFFNKSKVIKGNIDLGTIDLVVSHWSSFIYEAALQNLPLILVNPDKAFDFAAFRFEDYPIFVSTPKEMQETIIKIENEMIDIEEVNENFLNLHFGKGFGPSSDNLLSVLKSDLSESQTKQGILNENPVAAES